MNKWETTLGIKYPECKMTGQCCRMASPSTPAIKLLQKASDGNSYARDFFSIFVPYSSQEEAKNLSPELVEKALKAASKQTKFDDIDQVHFYKCYFLTDDNKCCVCEDRPQLCRDFPDTPFLVMPPGCGFEEWSKQCKLKYSEINESLKLLKEVRETLTSMSYKSLNDLIYSKFWVSPESSWYI